VGELTSYHESGLANFELDEHDIMLGEWWELRRPLSRAVWTIITRDWPWRLGVPDSLAATQLKTGPQPVA